MSSVIYCYQLDEQLLCPVGTRAFTIWRKVFYTMLCLSAQRKPSRFHACMWLRGRLQTHLACIYWTCCASCCWACLVLQVNEAETRDALLLHQADLLCLLPSDLPLYLEMLVLQVIEGEMTYPFVLCWLDLLCFLL